jgi:hypothetical protein
MVAAAAAEEEAVAAAAAAAAEVPMAVAPPRILGTKILSSVESPLGSSERVFPLRMRYFKMHSPSTLST